MALMFPRLARNFAKNGYYPTDEATLERVLNALETSHDQRVRILDPCAGEGMAILETAYRLGRERTDAYGIEYDLERARHMQRVVDVGIQSDLMDTVISPRSFGLLFFNPPYGDLVGETGGSKGYAGKGRQRLEKLFYQRSVHLLQYGGVMVMIVPGYVFDDELSSWVAQHFDRVSVHRAVVDTFQQVIVFGVRTRRNALLANSQTREVKTLLQGIGSKDIEPDILPEYWSSESYDVPPAMSSTPHCYRVTLEPEQLEQEMDRLGGLWPDFNLAFWTDGVTQRRPLRQLSSWHLALSLAAGGISGIVTSRSGRQLVVKGDTFKEKTAKVEFEEDADGNITERRILTDRFVPAILAWDVTADSPDRGRLFTITSTPAAPAVAETTDSEAETA
ncbi:SAM-dependent methyltransferase [Chromohalobacter israelensis]|uniref:SAM-dependent methyltransferase n=1 Tax=Chromohalobacter israelensis TaxID=141390 RepID=UPI000552D1DF